jgi:hydrogenase/urease accessory protein HupE
MIRWLLVLVLLALPVAAQADEIRPGYVAFTQESATGWALSWKLPMRGGLTPESRPILPGGCMIEGEPQRAIAGVAVEFRAKVTCKEAVAGGKIGMSAMVTSQTDILVRVAPLGRPVQALRLTADVPVATIAEKPDRWRVAKTYFLIGVEHILFGYDHLLFVVCLVLLLSGLWTIAKAVTAFTVAHSVTLIGTTMGLIGLPQAPVEAVIALSIMFLAVEILKKDPDRPRLSERLPWLVALFFGLLHGFGFAGALREVGLPESDVPTALLTFNLGVEAGQLLIVVAAIAMFRVLRRCPESAGQAALKLGAYAIGVTASYWFIERLIA